MSFCPSFPTLILTIALCLGVVVSTEYAKDVSDNIDSVKIDALINSFTEEEMVGMAEIISFLKLDTEPRPDPEVEDVKFNILSQQHFLREHPSHSISEEELVSLSELGLLKSDIEEVEELAKVMRLPIELSKLIEETRDDELLKVSEMSPSELESFANNLKSHKGDNKIVSRRDADPEPEPEPEPEPNESEPSKFLSNFYHPYVSHTLGKRAAFVKPSFRLRLRAKKGFGKGRRRRKNRQKYRRRHKQPHFAVDLRFESGARGSYGRRNEHRGRYGDGFRWRRGAESYIEEKESKVDGAGLADSDGVELVLAPESSKPNLRRKRHVMEALMSMIGMKKEQEEHPEVLYMSATMDGQKHEVSREESEEQAPAPQLVPYKPLPAYTPSKSYKQAVARARLVKIHN